MQSTSCLLDLMSAKQRENMMADAVHRQLRIGETLFNKGEAANNFFLVKKGQVKLIRLTATGDEKVFKVFLPKGLIAEMAMFMPEQTYPMTAIAETDSEIWVISKKALLTQIEASSELAISIMGFMSQRISILMNSIDTLTQVNAEQRFIMFLAQLYAKQPNETFVIHLPFSKKIIANQICVKPETLSRILKKFKDRDLIQERGAHLTLPDVEALCHFVELLPDIFSLN